MIKSEHGGYEQLKALQGYSYIVGVDEVGRGPWAGPVVAAAVILGVGECPEGVTDSKKLTDRKRREFSKWIHDNCHVSIAESSVEEIDRLNIREATFLAMKRAVEGLPYKADYAFIDGNAIPKGLPCTAEAVVKGDSKILSIACASIVAKVYRDDLMINLAANHPHFAWEKNAGYGTKAHQEGLKLYGVTPHHRRSFRPISELLNKG